MREGLLAAWGDDVAVVQQLTGGAANDIWEVRVRGERAVVRSGDRSDADLAWETGLLAHLHRAGLAVPVPVPTVTGRLFSRGALVMSYVEGGPPRDEVDWRRVAEVLREVHRLTRGWPQRPGWRSSTDLLHHDAGTRVDLRRMPADGVVRCRAAWRRLAGWETSVVHGDPNAGNIRMTGDRVALIDWDEAHVDVSALDLALPHDAAGFGEREFDVVSQASAAWEAAVCWDDDHARRCLAQVRAAPAPPAPAAPPAGLR